MFRSLLFALLISFTTPCHVLAQENTNSAPVPDSAPNPTDDATPAGTESLSTEPADQGVATPVTIDALETRLAEIEALVNDAQNVSSAGTASDPTAELRTRYLTALQDLENVIQRRITSIKRRDEVRNALGDLESQAQSFTTDGIDPRPPYKVTFLDQLRDDREAAEREAASDGQSLDTLTTSAEQAARRLRDAEQQRRAARDALEALTEETDRTAAELQLAISEIEQELAEREVSLVEAQREIIELQQQLNKSRAALLEQKIAFVAENVLFTPKELQEQLDEHQERQNDLDRQLREARRTDAANQSRLESARETLASARGEDAIRVATEALAAREAWAQASSRAVELLQERMDNHAKAKLLWERRFALRQSADEAQLAGWERDTSALIEEFARRREDLERRLRDLRVAKAEIENRLASPETTDAVKRELESRVKAIEKREEQSNAYLAGLIGVERLAQRVLAEVKKQRKLDSWGATWSRIAFTGRELWGRELFVIDDKGFHAGEIIVSLLVFMLVLVISYFGRGVLHRTVLRQLQQRAHKTDTGLDDLFLAIMRSTRTAFIVTLGLYIGLRSLPLSERLDGWLNSIIVIAVVFQVSTWANVAVQRAIDRTKRRRVAEDPSSVSAFGLMGFFSRVAIWAVALLIILDNLGVQITALVASLGIGGIAIAFALQNILGDVFCSIAILLDKPFAVGDFIIVGDLMGTVEHIGIKTTRIRSLGGEQIIFSNADLMGSRIRNYKRMYERRVVFGFGIVYETPVDKIAEIPEIVRGIISRIEKTRFDRAHFKNYGDFSLNFEVVYYVLAPDYNTYMDIQQTINLDLFRELAKRDISFAYPTQELIVRRSNGVELAGAGGARASSGGGES